MNYGYNSPFPGNVQYSIGAPSGRSSGATAMMLWGMLNKPKPGLGAPTSNQMTALNSGAGPVNAGFANQLKTAPNAMEELAPDYYKMGASAGLGGYTIGKSGGAFY